MIGNLLRKKLASWDQCGYTPSLSYRREASYGTALGGICSIVATLLVMMFVVSELYGLIIPSQSHKYDQQV